jgi:glycosyltransferase involved in cell wall biosynthesis
LCSVAGDSGGSAEAVTDGKTGLLVGGSVPASGVARALGRLLGDDNLRSSMATAARQRAETVFSYDLLAAQLTGFLEGCAPSK